MVILLLTICCVLQSLDLAHIKHIFKRSKEASEDTTSAQITPLQPGDVKCIDDVSNREEMRWIRSGFKLIAQARCQPFALDPRRHVGVHLRTLRASFVYHPSDGQNSHGDAVSPVHALQCKSACGKSCMVAGACVFDA